MCSSDTGSIREDEFQDKPRFPGAENSYYTEKMSFVDPQDGETIPVYRVMDRNGKVFDESHDPKVRLIIKLNGSLLIRGLFGCFFLFYKMC